MSEKGWENVFLSHKNEKFRKDSSGLFIKS